MKEYHNAQHAFEDLYNKIHTKGEIRGNGTYRLKRIGFTILNPEDNHIKTVYRGWNKVYADREFNWYLSGDRSVKELAKKAPIWDTMHNGDSIVNSNYGYQWQRNDQLNKCIEDLKNNCKSRQSWLTIMDGKEKSIQAHDTPCTLAIGFEITNSGKLEMEVLMRSNDLWFGFCNDQYCFSELQKIVAKELKLPIGTYYHYASDMHLYTNKMDRNPYIQLPRI